MLLLPVAVAVVVALDRLVYYVPGYLVKCTRYHIIPRIPVPGMILLGSPRTRLTFVLRTHKAAAAAAAAVEKTIAVRTSTVNSLNANLRPAQYGANIPITGSPTHNPTPAQDNSSAASFR